MYLVIFKTLTNEIVASKKFKSLKAAEKYAELVCIKSLIIYDWRIVVEN